MRLQSILAGSACLAATTVPLAAQELMPLQPVPGVESYVGTVRARDVHGVSYGVRGCIAEVSREAVRNQVATADQVLVRLDDAQSQLAMRTAEARLSDLRAAVSERHLDVANAEAAERRRAEELAFVSKEFERNQTMFRRGLINETTMEGVERRMMDARFAAEQAKEAVASAGSARARAEIAVGIGELDLQTAQIAHDDLVLTAPFDGVLIGFDPQVGACVTEGALAAQLYDPARKAVDVYVLISRLSGTSEDTARVSRGAKVSVRRGNGTSCPGQITWIDTEADLESQYVKTTIDLDEACAPDLFLNEAVDVEITGGQLFRVPATAVLEQTVYLTTEHGLAPVQVEIMARDGDAVVLRLPDDLKAGTGQSIVVDAMDPAIEGALDPS